nr:oligosaccharide flippase family protein [Halothiobacillus sp.]
LATVSGVLTGALQGRSMFLELNIISLSSSALTQLLPLAVVLVHGPDLAWILPAVILSRLVTLTLLFLRCRVHVFYGHAPTFSRAQAKGLLQFGGWVSVTSLIGPMMVILDRFVIGATLGAKAVAYYTVPFQLAERSSVLPGALTLALFPRLAAANAAEARQLAATALRSLAVVMTPLILIGVLLVEPFLRWWLNAEFASRAGLTAQVLLLGFWINSFARVPYAQLQAAGKPSVVAKCHLGELIPYLLLLYTGLHFWGLPGAAVVFGLRTLADCALLMWFAGILQVGVQVLKTPVMLLLAGLAIAAGLPVGNAMWWLAAFGVLLLSLGWSWGAAPLEVRNVVIFMVNKLSTNKRENFL